MLDQNNMNRFSQKMYYKYAKFPGSMSFLPSEKGGNSSPGSVKFSNVMSVSSQLSDCEEALMLQAISHTRPSVKLASMWDEFMS